MLQPQDYLHGAPVAATMPRGVGDSSPLLESEGIYETTHAGAAREDSGFGLLGVSDEPFIWMWKSRAACLDVQRKIVVHDWLANKHYVRPAICGKWDCPDCGKGMRDDLRRRLRWGLLRKNEGEVLLLTHTFRTKWITQSWDSYCDPDVQRAVVAQFGEHFEVRVKNQVNLYRWLMDVNRRFGRAALVWARNSLFHEKEFDAAYTHSWRVYRQAFFKKFGFRFDFFQAFEYTGQRIPHYHTVIPCQSWSPSQRDEYRDWMLDKWTALWPDTTLEAQHATYARERHRDGSKIQDFQHAINYALGYVGKAEHELPWGTHRFRRSHGWQVPDVGPESRFLYRHHQPWNHLAVFNWFGWRRVRSRWHRDPMRWRKENALWEERRVNLMRTVDCTPIEDGDLGAVGDSPTEYFRQWPDCQRREQLELIE